MTPAVPARFSPRTFFLHCGVRGCRFGFGMLFVTDGPWHEEAIRKMEISQLRMPRDDGAPPPNVSPPGDYVLMLNKGWKWDRTGVLTLCRRAHEAVLAGQQPHYSGGLSRRAGDPEAEDGVDVTVDPDLLQQPMITTFPLLIKCPHHRPNVIDPEAIKRQWPEAWQHELTLRATGTTEFRWTP